MAEAEFKYDVFISYSHKDEEWVVNTLLPYLEDAGLKVCIDFRDFVPGKLSRHNMRDACKESAYTILVITSSWIDSEWTTLESLFSFLHDPIGKRQRTVPILLENCDIPEDIQIFTYIDFVRKDRETIAWKRLLNVLNKSNARTAGQLSQEIEPKNLEGWFLAHPYGMPPNFTGRYAERNMLTGWLNEDKDHPLLILRALGGFGKSALAWHWLTNDVNATRWPKVVWWSFYEGDSSFENFLNEVLQYIYKVNTEQMNPHEQTETLLSLLKRPGILLILDGFERALRAFGSMGISYRGDNQEKNEDYLQDNSRDCINPYADTFLRSIASFNNNLRGKILMTTRLTPRAVENEHQTLEGCLEVELGSMNKADAISFFRARGVRGPGVEIEDICASYGYHPLSLRLLAGLIMSSSDNSRDIAVARKLDITENIIQNKHHVLEHAYNSLTQMQQTLLCTIACFRGSIDYKTLQLISSKYEPSDEDINVLVERGLLHHAELIKKFDLHPIVRRYSYDRLTAADRKGAHERLINYFEAVPKPEKVEKLEDLAPVIELYHHTVRAGKLDNAIELFRDRFSDMIYYQLGGYQIIVELLLALFLDGEDRPPRLKKESAQAWTLDMLANAYSLSGQPRRAVQAFKLVINIDEKNNEKSVNAAITLGNVAQQQLVIGTLRETRHNLRRSIDLCRENENEYYYEGIGHAELGRMLIYAGLLNEAEKEFPKAIELLEKGNGIQQTGVVWAYRALRFLFLARADPQSSTVHRQSSIESASRALELADEEAKKRYPHPRDYIRAYWLLGAAYRANSELNEAEENLSKAISMCRQINLVEMEADILLDLARLRYDQKNYEEAKSLAEEALNITERCGYVLQGADVNLFLAQYALEQEKDKKKAKEYAETALKLATCDGPPYYYKVAYHEAERMLKDLA